MFNGIGKLFLATALALSLTPSRCQAVQAQDPVTQIVAALNHKEFQLALRLCRSALTHRPTDDRIWTLRGLAEAGGGDSAAALNSYHHALTIDPTYLPALEGAGQVAFQLKNKDAEAYLLRILSLRPENETAHAMLGMLAYAKKDCQAAIDHFQKATRPIADNAEALTDYGVCLGSEKRDEDAIALFTQALALAPQRRETHFNLALALNKVHRDDEAMSALKPILEGPLLDEDVLSLAIAILDSKSDTADAVELLHNAIMANPRDVYAYLQFALLSFDHSSPQVGIDILNAGLSLMPGEPRLYLVRGVLLTQLGEFDRAADDFESANRLDPQLQFLGVAKGLVQSQQHKSDTALASFRDAVAKHPNEAYAQYLLAEALNEGEASQGGAAHDEMLRAVKRAIELDPHLAQARDLLAGAYLQDAMVEESEEQSRAALEIDPTDQSAIYHLILTSRKTARKDQVAALVKRLVELRDQAQREPGTAKVYRLVEEGDNVNTQKP